MSQLPTPLRAAIGLAATMVDRLRRLPDEAPELPAQFVGNAMQLSLRAQQQLAALVARGDEVLGQIHGPSDEPPAWATFDESPADAPNGAAPPPGGSEPATPAAVDLPVVPVPIAPVTGRDPAAKKAKATAKKVPAMKASAKPARTTPAKKALAKKARTTPAKQAAARKAPAKKTAAAGKAPANATGAPASTAGLDPTAPIIAGPDPVASGTPGPEA
jgi:hypothetical protein